MPHHVFLSKEGEPRILVDRLSVAPRAEAVALAETAVADRGRTLHGCAAMGTAAVRRNGRDVVATPVPGRTPHHGAIVLPDSSVSDREELTRYAQELADALRWRPRPVN